MWFLGARIEISAEERLTACRASFDIEIKCLQLHIYGQLSLKITGLACFGKSWRIFIICVERAPCKVRFLDAACTVFVLAVEELSTYYA